MATVHPPARAVLQGTVPVELVVIVVEGAELLAVVGRVELVAGIVTKVKAGKGVAGITAKVEAVHQTVLVLFTSHPEHVVVGVPGGRIMCSKIFFCSKGSCLPTKTVCSLLA